MLDILKQSLKEALIIHQTCVSNLEAEIQALEDDPMAQCAPKPQKGKNNEKAREV